MNYQKSVSLVVYISFRLQTFGVESKYCFKVWIGNYVEESDPGLLQIVTPTTV
jgi:hypothetical protein